MKLNRSIATEGITGDDCAIAELTVADGDTEKI